MKSAHEFSRNWRRRIKWAALCLVALLCGLIAWLFFPEAAPQTGPEPVYQGRTLSDWTRQYAGTIIFTGPTTYLHVDGMGLPARIQGANRSDPAAMAIKQMGTNALPTLFAMLRYEDSSRVRLASRCDWLFDWMDDKQRMRYLPSPAMAFYKHVDATFGLYVLGPVAAPALRQALKDKNRRVRETAADLLTKLQ
jgi:hypothetical protein